MHLNFSSPMNIKICFLVIKKIKKFQKVKKQAVSFIKQKLDAAKWFIEAINQRNQTLLITMKTIMDFQKNTF